MKQRAVSKFKVQSSRLAPTFIEFRNPEPGTRNYPEPRTHNPDDELELGQRLGYLFTPKQVGIIVEKLNKVYTPDAEVAKRIREERREKRKV
ncbi:MAG: hypothetical protein JST46_10490 [Bacteroidetes bacterium]|nr:hypothetical protein [Bacteroidota bacterium]